MDMDTLEADFQLSIFKGMQDKEESQRSPQLQLNGQANGENSSSSSGSVIVNNKDSVSAKELDETPTNCDSNPTSPKVKPMETDEDSKDVTNEKEDDHESREDVGEEKTSDSSETRETEEKLECDQNEKDEHDPAAEESAVEAAEKSAAESDHEDGDQSKSEKRQFSSALQDYLEGRIKDQVKSTDDQDQNEDPSDKKDVKESLNDDENDKSISIVEKDEDSWDNKSERVDAVDLTDDSRDDKITDTNNDSKDKDDSKKDNEGDSSQGSKASPSKDKVVITVSDSPASKSTPASNTANRDKSVINIAHSNKDASNKPKVGMVAPTPSSKIVPGETLRPMAKSLYDLGLDLARQQVYKDLIKIQNKKQTQSKLGDKEQKQLDKLIVAYDNIVTKNDPYQLDMVKCEKCGYNTESESVMELHKEHAHPSKAGKSWLYECAFCEFESQYPGDFFVHMEKTHKKRGRVHMQLANYICPYCPFENNSKRAYQCHLLRCEKNFKLKTNLVPSHADFDIPLVHTKQTQPKTNPVAPQVQRPALITTGKPSPQPSQLRPTGKVSDLLRTKTPTPVAAAKGMPPIRGGILPMASTGPGGQQLFQVGNQLYTLIHNQGQAFLTPFVQGAVVPNLTLQPRSQVAATGTSQRLPPPPPLRPQPLLNVQGSQPTSLIRQHSKSVADILATKRASTQQQPHKVPQKAATPQSFSKQSSTAPSGFEICEICGGFVKDRESLRIHFFYAHKVEIPADVFRNRQPHLTCETCKQRFWTYQGMVRHTQSVHDNQASKVSGKAAALCVICGEKNLPMGLLGHLVARHNVSIRKLIESNKCFLCKATFPVHFLLKMHMTKNHKEVISSSNIFNAFLKSLGLSKAFMPVASTDTTGSNSPVPTGLFENASNAKPNKKTGKIEFDSMGRRKRKSFESDMMVEVSPAQHPYKCSRCNKRFPMQEIMQKHYQDVHRNEKEQCIFCNENIVIGRPYVRHMKREHCGECSIVLKRLPKKDVEFYMAKRKRQLEEEEKAEKEDTVILDDDEDADAPPAKRQKLENNSDASKEKSAESDKENEKGIEENPPKDEPMVTVESETLEDEEKKSEEDEGGDSDDENKDKDHIADNKDDSSKCKDPNSPEQENEKEESMDVSTEKVKCTSDGNGGEIIELDGETIVVQKQDDC